MNPLCQEERKGQEQTKASNITRRTLAVFINAGTEHAANATLRPTEIAKQMKEDYHAVYSAIRRYSRHSLLKRVSKGVYVLGDKETALEYLESNVAIPSMEPTSRKLKRKKGEEALAEKALPTSLSKVATKKDAILKYHVNSPQMTACEIAEKLKTTPSYVWKVLSEARKPSKVERGRSGRLFGHGMLFYEDFVDKRWLADLDAGVVNSRTGMRQIGFKVDGDPCSCQIHINGHFVVFPHSNGWRSWLVDALVKHGWDRGRASLLVDHCQLTVKVAECGVKPLDPSFLPKDLYLETEWGLVVCRDNSPEKGVLELKLSIPKMQTYLGIPDVKKSLELLEQGSLNVAQRLRALEALFYMLIKLLQKNQVLSGDGV